MPTTADYLKYANLQMAAEAFLVNNDGSVKADIPNALAEGNKRGLLFTPTQASAFADPVKGWTVLDQRANTATGFSGTLFKNIQTGELVISFRSTEFIDDAARDNQATNLLEIENQGWAFGQLGDMEKWYADLNADPAKLGGKTFAVTGYSLGGHLATAFNLMHGQDTLVGGIKRVKEVVTFNGAGVGQIGGGTMVEMAGLLNMITSFNTLRGKGATVNGLEDQMQTAEGKAAYWSLKSAWSLGQPRPSSAVISSILTTPQDASVAVIQDIALLDQAWRRTEAIYKEAWRAPTKSSGNGSAPPNGVLDNFIAGESLDYQMAVLITARDNNTSGRNKAQNLLAAFNSKEDGNPFVPRAPQFDIVGTEMDHPFLGAYDMVGHSQFHYGTEVPVFIEDQPLLRGYATLLTLYETISNVSPKLLVDGFSNNDFGDTHSLVLLVDSMSVMNLMQQIMPSLNQADVETIFKAASAAQAQSVFASQGKAEGDVLETVVNALTNMLLDTAVSKPLKASLDGNTWFKVADWTDTDGTTYTGRDSLYKRLDAISKAITDNNLAGKFEFLPLGDTAAAGTAARSDYALFLSLYHLAPFKLKAADATATALLKSANEGLAEAWEADLALTDEQRANGYANFSDNWLTDRAAMLSWVMKLNTEDAITFDSVPYQSGGSVPIQYFEDTTSGQKLVLGAAKEVAPRYLFGSDTDNLKTNGNDILIGGTQSDRLYGQSGLDILSGQAGNDLLEAGADNDLLLGGTGDDQLKGGRGLDSYVWNSGDGNDTLTDSDKSGRILFDGTAVKLLVKTGDTTWTTADGKVTLTQGDTWKLDIAGSGNRIPQADRDDTLYGTATGQRLYGGGGDDVLLARGGADIVEAGDGNDIASGEGDDDAVFANYQTDMASAWSANEAADGQAVRGDWVDGDSGNDLLGGSNARDLLSGGRDNDLLLGGAGDDLLLGDVTFTSANRYWSVTPDISTDAAGVTHYIYRINNATTDNPVDTGGADALHGGSGNDWALGGAGDDLIDGGTDNDVLFGDAGNDIVLGGADDGLERSDVLSSGGGILALRWCPNRRITSADFHAANDVAERRAA